MRRLTSFGSQSLHQTRRPNHDIPLGLRVRLWGVFDLYHRGVYLYEKEHGPQDPSLLTTR